MKKGFSIILCSFNGKERLQKTLEHIIKLKIPSGLYAELIFVDNRSTDGTFEFVENFLNNYGGQLEYFLLKESKPGKAYALEKALNEAKFSYGLICDDDNWLDTDYLINAKLILDEFPDVGLIGGKSFGVFEKDPPDWFPKVENVFIIGDQAKEEGYFDQYKDFVWGAGMVFRMEIWEKLQSTGFRFITGKNVTKAVGEDTEFSMISKFLGYRFYYSKALILRHFMPKERLNWFVAKKYCEGFGLTGPYYTFYKKIFLKGKSLTFLEIEIEILKRILLVILNLYSLNKKKSNKEGDLKLLKYIDKLHYLKELFSFTKLRRNIYNLNNQMKKVVGLKLVK